jgi:hypothetical protein
MFCNRSASPALVLIILSLAACESSSPPTSPSGLGIHDAAADSPAAAPHAGAHAPAASAAPAAQINQGIAEVRRLMAPFHNFEKAVEAGYSVPAPGPGVCLSDPVRGGMGYHYTRADKDLINDGVVNLLEPEFIVYSPTKNGSLRLSAADYFVPYTTWTDPEPPSLLGIPFAREDAFQAWVLHIWAFWPNPAGMFENFNPDVPQCPE